ncbi:MAG: hypothetical protein HGA40_04455, partial [Methanoregulaceae archaeon]|nr:hypothetical protein [Methanoregulaceae archaeon]
SATLTEADVKKRKVIRGGSWKGEVAEFIGQGKNVFARHVVTADPAIRAGDEVVIVNPSDELLATGEAVLSGREMLVFNYGAAVKVRQGRYSP